MFLTTSGIRIYKLDQTFAEDFALIEFWIKNLTHLVWVKLAVHPAHHSDDRTTVIPPDIGILNPTLMLNALEAVRLYILFKADISKLALMLER